MGRAILALTAFFVIVLLMESLTIVKVADANPTWGTSATPIPPITDPPQITITSPNSIQYVNPVPLNITIIQPDSWVNRTDFSLPNGWVDNSVSVVVGQNTLRSVTCIIDGQSIIIWKGTPVGYGITHFLPKVTQFSAAMNLSKGQHNLQVNVLAESEWITEGIIPFAQRTYLISANQSATFRVEDGSDAPMIYDIKSSYVIWQSSSIAMPSPTSAPPQSLSPVPTSSPIPTSALSPTASPYTPSPSPSPVPTLTPSVPEFSWLAILPLFFSVLFFAVILKHRKNIKSNRQSFSTARCK